MRARERQAAGRYARSGRAPRAARGLASLCAVAAAAALALACAGCAGAGGAGTGAPASATRSFTSMDTGMALTVHAAGQQAADDAARACEERVRALDGLLAGSGDASDVARLNAADGAAAAVSPDTASLLATALAVARETDGAFDPTVYPVTSAWGFTSGDHRVPSADELAALLPRVGYAHAHVDEAAGTVTLDPGTQVDVGGVAKGFAADELRALLSGRGVTSALLDLGGNVTAVGGKPDGAAWKVGVADPASPDRIAGTLQLRDATASTSGDYQRCFVDDAGRRWHHLVDPATGYPADTGLASVTVVGPDAARCDALSTALFVKGLDGALDAWRGAAAAAGPGAEAPFELVLVDDDGNVVVTEGLAGAFSLREGYGGALAVAAR